MPPLPRAFLCIFGVRLMLVDQIDLNSKPETENTTFFKKQNVKRVLLCLHGFKTSTRHDCVDFKNYFNKVNTNPNFEIQNITFYEWGNSKTYRHKMFYEVCRKAVKGYIDKGYVVYILAYSFSASIGAKLCVEFPQIDKLVLVAPTTYLIRTKLLINYVAVANKQIHLKLKYRKKATKIMKKTKTERIITLFWAMTFTLLAYRKYLKKIKCKVFMIKGAKDEFSINHTFSYVSYKAKDAITISKVYPNHNHTMFMDVKRAVPAFRDVLYFIFHIDNPDCDILNEKED